MIYTTEPPRNRGDLSLYFAMRTPSGEKERDRDPAVNFLLLYSGNEPIGGVRYLTTQAGGSTLLHIERRADVNICQMIHHQYEINIKGRAIVEVASIVIAPKHRAIFTAVNFYRSIFNHLLDKGTDIFIAAPHDRNAKLAIRIVEAANYKSYSLGQTTVNDDNICPGRLKNIFITPVAQDLILQFQAKNQVTYKIT